MIMNTGDWTFNNTDDGNWCHDQFSTKEEAVSAGIEYAKEEGWFNLYVGQIQEIPVDSPIDADDVIEDTAERIDDNYGGEYEPGQNFLDGIECGDSERLQELLDEAFYKWVEERKISCQAFTIENIEQVTLPDILEGK